MTWLFPSSLSSVIEKWDSLPGLVTQLHYEAAADLRVEHAIKNTVTNITLTLSIW